MADFNVDSNFNSDANYSRVKIGAGYPVLDVEFNEIQLILQNALRNIFRDLTPSGFTKMPNWVYSNYIITLSTDSVVQIDGGRIFIPADTTISCPSSPSGDALVFLEAWYEEVDYTDTIKKYGGEGQPSVTNSMVDSRMGYETSRRVQLKWRIRIQDGLNFSSQIAFDDMIYPQGAKASPYTGYTFTACGGTNIDTYGKSDVGLYIAGDPANLPASRTNLGTTDGFSYMVPLFALKTGNVLVDIKRNSALAPSGYGLGSRATRLVSGSNLDLLVNNGWYDVQNPANGVPGLTWHKIFVINSADSGNMYVTQLAFTMTDNGDYMCIRQCNNGVWQSWKKIASVADNNTWTGSNVFNTETHFTDGTYSDPWSGTSCAIKAAGHLGVGGNIRATGQLISMIGNGTAPLSVNSTTKVTGLNADLIDGYHAGNGNGNIPVSNGTLNTNLNAEMVGGYTVTELDSRYVNVNGDTMGGDLYFDTSTEKRVCPVNASYRWGMFLNSSRVGWYDWANSRSIMYYQASNGDIVADRIMRFGAGASGIGRISAYSWNGTINNGVSANFTHNLGYKPIVNFSGTRGNIIMTVEHTDLNNFTVTCYSSGGSNFTGYIYAW